MVILAYIYASGSGIAIDDTEKASKAPKQMRNQSAHPECARAQHRHTLECASTQGQYAPTPEGERLKAKGKSTAKL